MLGFPPTMAQGERQSDRRTGLYRPAHTPPPFWTEAAGSGASHRSRRMKKPRQSSYPMPPEEREDLAGELTKFGYRETGDPDEADRRNFYKVEKWDAGELHIETLQRSECCGARDTPGSRACRVHHWRACSRKHGAACGHAP